MMFIIIEEFCDNCGANHGVYATAPFMSVEAAKLFIEKHGADQNYIVNNIAYFSVENKVEHCVCRD